MEKIDEVEHVLAGFFLSLVFMRLIRSCLIKLKSFPLAHYSSSFRGGFHLGPRCVVLGSPATHAGELGTLVRMHLNFRVWIAPPDGHEQSVQRHAGIGAASH